MARLHVSNLPWTTTESDLRDFFASFAVSEVKLIIDRETGRSRGFGFVEVGAGADDVIRACDGRPLGGRDLRIALAHEKPRTARQ